MLLATRSFNTITKNFRNFSKLTILAEKLIRSRVLSVKDEVQTALERSDPVVALESTIITHGLPYPDNVKCAMDVENEIREKV